MDRSAFAVMFRHLIGSPLHGTAPPLFQYPLYSQLDRSQAAAPGRQTRPAQILGPSEESGRDEWVEITGQQLLLLSVRLSNEDGTDPWIAYQAWGHEMQAAYEEVLRGAFGPHIEFKLQIQRGSIFARIIARVKSAWGSAKESVEATFQRARVNISDVRRKLCEVTNRFFRRASDFMNHPKTRVVAETTWHLTKETANVAASVVAIASWFFGGGG